MYWGVDSGCFEGISRKIIHAIFVGVKTPGTGVFTPKELTHFLHEVLCAKGFKVNTPGSGNINLAVIFQSLRQINYTGALTFESFSSAIVQPQLVSALAIWRELWSDSEDLARQAKKFMEKQLSRTPI